MANEKAEEIVAAAASTVGQMEIPHELQTRIARQNAHLIELAGNLLAYGLDESRIKSVIGEAMASYEEELVQTILALRQETDDV